MAEQDCPVCGEGPYSRVLRHITLSHPDDREQFLLDELERLSEDLGKTPTGEDMNQCGRFNMRTYDRTFGSWNEALEKAGFALNHEYNISEERLLQELERLSEELGRTPTQRDMNRLGRFDMSTYQYQFGSWNEALEEVGLSLNNEIDISKGRLLQEIDRLSEELGRTPTAKDMNQCGRFDTNTYHNQFGSWNEALEETGLSPNMEIDISEERLLQEIGRLSEELGRTPTQEDMNRSGRFSVNVYKNQFGSWNEALEEVGLALNKERDIPRGRLLQEIDRLSEELGRTPTQEDMNRVGRFSNKTYQIRFGSWNKALEEVGLALNNEYNISEERLLQEIERLSEELGRTPTQEDMNSVGRFSVYTYQNQFSSWNGAIQEAGLPINNEYGTVEPSAKRNRALYHWGKAVKKRDGFECQDCGQVGGNLASHHIKRRSNCNIEDGIDKALALWNGVTLCAQCHANRHRNDPYHHLLKHDVESFSYEKTARRQSKNRKVQVDR